MMLKINSLPLEQVHKALNKDTNGGLQVRALPGVPK